MVSKTNDIKVLISKALTDSYISHEKFVLVNKVLKAYDDLKEKVKNLKEIWIKSKSSISI